MGKRWLLFVSGMGGKTVKNIKTKNLVYQVLQRFIVVYLVVYGGVIRC
jgi:hypothetical protein